MFVSKRNLMILLILKSISHSSIDVILFNTFAQIKLLIYSDLRYGMRNRGHTVLKYN
jgi:hypothetical protein